MRNNPSFRINRFAAAGVCLSVILTACGGGGTPTYIVSASAGVNGAIGPTSVTVSQGNTARFTVTPDTGFLIAAVIGCGGTRSGNTYTTGKITAACTVTASFVARTLGAVSAVFPAKGANWNDYVTGSTWSTATDTACNATTNGACLHGGELRVVVATGKTDCNGLTATDDLGVFNWVCDASTGTARLVSIGLAHGKGLSDLIDFTTAAFKGNKVTVYENNAVWGTTPSTTWWSNPISVNNGGGSLNTASTIYLVTAQPRPATDYTLDADKVALVIQPGVIVTGPGTNSSVVSSFLHNYLWIEGHVDASGDAKGVSLSSVRFSVLHELEADNATGGSALGVYLASGSNHNRISEVTATNNGNDGVELDIASSNTLSNVIASNNGANGIYLSNASNNTLSSVKADNDNSMGIYLAGSSVNNTLSGATSNNNAFGMILYAGANDNTVSGVTVANNSVGIDVNGVSYNTLSGITASNNTKPGIAIINSSHDNTFANVAVGNNGTGLVLTDVSNNTFTGLLEIGSNGTDCFVGGGTHPGLDGTCANEGSSDAALTSGITLANSFVGKVLVDDGQNASDTNGAANFPTNPAAFDWTHFDNGYRGWGIDGSAFPNADQQGRWIVGTGRIWDWSAAIGDNGNWDGAPALLGVIGFPSGSDTITQAWSGKPATKDDAGCDALVAGSKWNGTANVCQTTFLRNAVEIQGDGAGNDNTLCESGEICLYMPNIGSYQGHGKLISAGAFSAGTLTGITLMKYDTNGR